MRAIVLGSLILALLGGAREARAQYAGCAAVPCGFTFADALECGTLPANHQLELRVTCSRGVDPVVLPRLRLADGTELPSIWEQRIRPFELSPFLTEIGYEDRRSLYANNESIYVRTGPELSVGEIVEVVGHVPARCASVLRAESFLHYGLTTRLLCWDHPDDCCATHGSHGVTFPVPRTSEGPASAEIEWQPNYTYLRFRTTEPDQEPPPELPVEVDCRIDRGGGEYRIDVTIPPDDLDDVVEVEVLARRAGEDELLAAVLRAPPCMGGEPRTFELSPGLVGQLGWFREETSNDWSFFLRAHDASANVSTGQEILLQFPGDCVETSDLSAREPLVAVCSNGSLSGGTAWCRGAGGAGGEPPSADTEDPSWLDHELPAECPEPQGFAGGLIDWPLSTGGSAGAGTGGWGGSRRGHDYDVGCGCRLVGSTSPASVPLPGESLIIAGLSCWGVRRFSSRRRGVAS